MIKVHVMPSCHLYINNSVTDPHSGMWCMTGPALYFVQLGEGTVKLLERVETH